MTPLTESPLRLLTVALALACVSAATTVAAQSRQAPVSTFHELRQSIQPGLRVDVTTNAGVRVRGRVESLGETLRVLTEDGARDFSESDLREVRLRGDRLWNGALIGAGVGFLGGGAANSGNCTESGEGGFCFVVGGAIGASIGALAGMLIDMVQPHREVLYARPPQAGGWTAGPLIGAGTYGVRLQYGF